MRAIINEINEKWPIEIKTTEHDNIEYTLEQFINNAQTLMKYHKWHDDILPFILRLSVDEEEFSKPVRNVLLVPRFLELHDTIAKFCPNIPEKNRILRVNQAALLLLYFLSNMNHRILFDGGITKPYVASDQHWHEAINLASRTIDTDHRRPPEN